MSRASAVRAPSYRSLRGAAPFVGLCLEIVPMRERLEPQIALVRVDGCVDVNEHEVVPPREPTHGWLPVETRMRARAIVVLQPAGEDAAAIGRGVVRPPIRPLAQRGLDESLRFAVRAGRVGTGVPMAHAQGATGGPKAPRAI